jgi:hypothetical protein
MTLTALADMATFRRHMGGILMRKTHGRAHDQTTVSLAKQR